VFAIVVPADGDECNEKCPGCIIGQRGEGHARLSDRDYTDFVDDLLQAMPDSIASVNIQGFEALMPDAWRWFTKPILEHVTASGRLDLQTLLVTNGIALPQYVRLLSGLVDNLLVSINSADARTHDKTRGVPGCFQLTVRGMQAARKFFEAKYVTAAAILFPWKGHFLKGLPTLLDTIDVRNLVITPYINLCGRELDSDFLCDTVSEIYEEGARVGVGVSLADELRQFPDLHNRVPIKTVPRDYCHVRLSPTGALSIGPKQFLQASSGSLRWPGRLHSEMLPSQFLRRGMTNAGYELLH
jgi:pyruvate-formate lyase-activating enzyme